MHNAIHKKIHGYVFITSSMKLDRFQWNLVRSVLNVSVKSEVNIFHLTR